MMKQGSVAFLFVLCGVHNVFFAAGLEWLNA
jgi:hypothetical protein